MIIEAGESGFHIDPSHGDQAAVRIVEFLDRCQSEEGYWQTLSKASLRIRPVMFGLSATFGSQWQRYWIPVRSS